MKYNQCLDILKKKILEDRLNSTCNHFEHCNIAKISGKDCSRYLNCQTYRFYNRYGRDWNLTGIGAMTEPPDQDNQITKKLHKAICGRYEGLLNDIKETNSE